MKRLRDSHDASDPLEARAARLLSAHSPLSEATGKKQRVRARLRRRRPTGPLVLRAAMVLVGVCSVALAGAAVGKVARTLIVHYRETQQAPAPSPKKVKAPRPVVPPIAPALPMPPPIAPAPPPPIAPPIAPAPPMAPKHAPVATPVVRHFVAPVEAVPAPSVSSEEQRLLSAAMRALRRDHDAGRAAEILTLCLTEYPDSPAAEDTFALALEATVGRDPARAATLAGDYLRRFPSGRWTPLARRALSR